VVARALGTAVLVHAGRFAVILAGLGLADLLGIHGWDSGLFVNALCVVYAVVVVTLLGRWHSIGLTLRASRVAVMALVPLVVEALVWLVPDGIGRHDVGPGWWALTLLLVGINEELVSRGAALSVLQDAMAVTPAVLITAVLFGLQHLSLLVTSDRSVSDVAWTVGYTAIYGLALAAYQARHCWITPLIVLHAVSDFTGILSPGKPSDLMQVLVNAMLVGAALVWLRPSRRGVQLTAGASYEPHPPGPTSDR
jgi:uncharacterized protein